MDIQMGSHTFRNVEIPVLWGTRAILQDRRGRLSVIDLAGPEAKAEIIGGEPAPGVEFRPISDGFKIIRQGDTLYSFSKDENSIRGILLKLPPLQIQKDGIRVGTNRFQHNVVAGAGVGLAITETSVSMGAALPEQLARLVI